MFLASSIALFALVLVLVFWIRPSDLPTPPPLDPTAHLEERKAAIYDNLRDLTFEFRLGKLSNADYEKSKLGLQEELARVLAEIDSLGAAKPAAKPAQVAAKPAPAPAPASSVCPHCRARFDKPMKFCGECGKPMDASAKEATA